MIALNELFRYGGADWIRYSDYEYRATPSGELYLTPIQDAAVSVVDPLDGADSLLVDALNVGKLCMPEQPDMSAVRAAILAFAKQYGLLGFMAAWALKPDFIGRKEVQLNINPITDRPAMKTADYLKHFLPFGAQTDIIGSDGGGAAVASSLPITMFMDRPPVYEVIFSRDYAEKLDWLVAAFRQWYIHLAACHYYDKTDEPVLRELHAKTVAGLSIQGLSCCVKMLETPVLVWDFPSLNAAVNVLYGFYLTHPERPLRICKHCGKAFIMKNPRAEFCSVQCRNQFNVYKSRRK